MKLYRTAAGCVVEEEGQYYRLDGHSLDVLLAREDLPEFLAALIRDERPSQASSIRPISSRPSIIRKSGRPG